MQNCLQIKNSLHDSMERSFTGNKRLLRLFYDRIIFFLLPVKYSTEGFYSNPGLFCPFKAAFDCISANGMGYNSCLPSTKLCPAT